MIPLKSFLKLNTINSWLIACSAFNIMLSLVRVAFTQSPDYLFLPWNLFLAFIPYWLTNWMSRNSGRIENRWKFYCFCLAWLVFVPNAFYIVTDLFHLTHVDSAPKWFDILMVYSYAWNGILFGLLSIRKIEKMISNRWRREISIILVGMVMWLIALGVYIGRFLRFNSWDIITNPFSLFNEIFSMVLNPIENLLNWGMTFTYAIFMTLIYYTSRRLSESFTSLRSDLKV